MKNEHFEQNWEYSIKEIGFPENENCLKDFARMFYEFGKSKGVLDSQSKETIK